MPGTSAALRIAEAGAQDFFAGHGGLQGFRAGQRYSDDEVEPPPRLTHVRLWWWGLDRDLLVRVLNWMVVASQSSQCRGRDASRRFRQFSVQIPRPRRGTSLLRFDRCRLYSLAARLRLLARTFAQGCRQFPPDRTRTPRSPPAFRKTHAAKSKAGSFRAAARSGPGRSRPIELWTLRPRKL